MPEAQPSDYAIGDNPGVHADDLAKAAKELARLGAGSELTARIGSIESALAGKKRDAASQTMADLGIDEALLTGAIEIKGLAGQINVVIHAVGILVSLPYLLARDEQIQALSLGAGNTGRDHDLETDRRIAEFKFIDWRGGPESIRQNGLFIDLFNLASAQTHKRRYMYVLGLEHPERFLAGRRSLASVLSRNASAAERFAAMHGDQFATVADYAPYIRDRVELVDLREVVPAFSSSAL